MGIAERRSPVLTVCPFCACGCGLYLQESDGRATGVMPSEHHPVSAGRLCARGWAAHEASLWGPRLTAPMVRHNGRLEPATWPEALTAAADRLQRVTAGGGAVGVLGSGRATNEENFLAARLARGALQSDHIDSCLRAAYQALASGLRAANSGSHSTPTLSDLEACDVIFLLEGDLARTHPHVAFAVMRAVGRGGRLVTMGPVRTQMSRLAWLHLPLVPGDEPILAARLAVAADGGAPALSAAEPGAGALQSEAPSAHAHLVPSGEFRRAVDAYASAARAAVVLGSTSAAAASLHAVASAFAKLAVATGHANRPGSMLLALPVRSNTRGALEMGAAPNTLPGPCTLDDERARRRLRQVWQPDLACRRGLDADRMIAGVRGLVVVADEPSVALAAGAACRHGLAALDCLVALDAFVTPTVEASHVALPLASPVESEGTFTNLEGRVQRLRPAGSAPGDARPGWWVLSELAAALGMTRTYRSVVEVRDDIRAGVPSYAAALAGDEEGWADAEAIRRIDGHAGDRAADAEYAGAGLAGENGGGPPGSEYPFRLVTAGVIDWGADPLVYASPTLSRDHQSLARLFPDGVVEMSASDAGRLGIRQGWRVKLTSAHGEVSVPVTLSQDVDAGILLVPFAFRDRLGPVLGEGGLAGVVLERA